jgi:hypothetical protein
MRIAATIEGSDSYQTAELAGGEILAWAQNRSGGRLPAEPWQFRAFEHFSGGRNSVGIRIRANESDIWAIRAEDPDKSVPGRIWTSEIVIGLMKGALRPRFSARLLASSPEDDLFVAPHTPGFVQQIADRCGLLHGEHELRFEPWPIESADDAEQLVELLAEPARTVPVFALSVPENAHDPFEPLIDAYSLSRAVLGIGHVVIVPAEYTWALTDRFERVRSVFGGAVRSYLPGFSEHANPYDHRLVLPEQIVTHEGKVRCDRWMRSIAAAESVRRNILGRDVLAFATIRNLSLRADQERLSVEGATLGDQLAAAKARISALEKNIDEENATLEYFDSETKKAEERASTAEAQLRASLYRIRQLQAKLQEGGPDPDSAIAAPGSWSEFANWCDVNLAGRLALAPAARRGVRAPEFSDLSLVVRCVRWLATDYRDARINGGEGDFRDFTLEPGVRNCLCGGDEFDFDWQGRTQTADWHVKNGGNTRDPGRCLRIYYSWEPETQQVIVADMPAHRKSRLS